MCDIVEYSPGLYVVAVAGYLHVVDPVEQKGQGLQEHKGRHDPVDPKQQQYQNKIGTKIWRNRGEKGGKR